MQKALTRDGSIETCSDLARALRAGMPDDDAGQVWPIVWNIHGWTNAVSLVPTPVRGLLFLRLLWDAQSQTGRHSSLGNVLSSSIDKGQETN